MSTQAMEAEDIQPDGAADGHSGTGWVKRWNRSQADALEPTADQNGSQSQIPLVPLKDQVQYDALAPPQPAEKLRTVHLRCKGNDGLGFAVRGGVEHGVGVYVSHVVPESQAERQGLKVGDEVVRVNGFAIAQAIHQEALNLIKGQRELLLKVRNVGMLPIRNNIGDKLDWKYVKHFNSNNMKTSANRKHPENAATKSQEICLVLNVAEGTRLGCSICCGPAEKPGIFIQSQNPDGLGAEAGLEVGDQIMEVNGESFIGINQSEAMAALKASRHLKMRIHKGVGRSLFAQQQGPSDPQKLGSSQDKSGSQIVHAEAKKPAVVAQKEEYLPPTQDILLEQALQALEAHGESPQHPPHSASQPAAGAATRPRGTHRELTRDELAQQRENEALKKKKLMEMSEKQSSPEKTASKTKVTAIAQPSYLGYQEQKPSFTIQKPVMLNPIGKAAEEAHRKRSVASMVPTELEEAEIDEDNFNPYRVFTNEQIAGRQIRLINIRKTGGDLGLSLRGGLKEDGSGEDRIIIKEVLSSAIAHQQGGIHPGDQLMLVEWTSLMGLTLDHARDILQNAYVSAKPVMQLVVAKTPPKRGNEEILFVAQF